MLGKYFNKKAKMSLFSIFSIITVIIITMTALSLLDFAKEAYLNKINGSKAQQKPPKVDVPEVETSDQNKLLRKLYVMFYLVTEKLKTKLTVSTINENEQNAVKLLKKYAKAQEIYKKHYGNYANYASDLIIEKNGKPSIIDASLSTLNSAQSKKSAKNGYYFIQIVKKARRNKKGTYFVCAIPSEYGKTGINSYCIISTESSYRLLKNDNNALPVFDETAIDKQWEEVL